MKNYNVVKIFLLIVGVFMSSLSSAKGEECVWRKSTVSVDRSDLLILLKECYTDPSKTNIISEKDITLMISPEAEVSFETGEPIITYGGQTYDLNNAPKYSEYTKIFDTERFTGDFIKNSKFVAEISSIRYNKDGSYEIENRIYDNDTTYYKPYMIKTMFGSTEGYTGELLTTYKDNYNSSGQLISKYVDGSLIESYQYNADGTYTTYDANGNELGRFNADGSEYIKQKRTSYTIQEANDATPNPDGTYSVRLSF